MKNIIHQKIFKNVKKLEDYAGNLEMKILFSTVAKVHSLTAIYCILPYNNMVGKFLIISELQYYYVIFIDIGSKFYQRFKEFVLYSSLQPPN